jgi:hypothetical protein
VRLLIGPFVRGPAIEGVNGVPNPSIKRGPPAGFAH